MADSWRGADFCLEQQALFEPWLPLALLVEWPNRSDERTADWLFAQRSSVPQQRLLPEWAEERIPEQNLAPAPE
jgi:hypothetical protein